MNRKRRPRAYPDLKTWREARDWSQEEAAAFLEVSQITYSRLERRVRFAKGPQAKRLMDRTGVSIEVIAGVV